MTLSEFRDLTKDLPGEMEMVMQQADESSECSPLHSIDVDTVYQPITDWYGTAFGTLFNAEGYGVSEEEWEAILSQPRALLLIPKN